jgi:hypothetical protein
MLFASSRAASQAIFSEEEWFERQEEREAQGNPARIDYAAVDEETAVDTSEPFPVLVTLSYDDGTEETLTVELAYEDGAYKRHLTDEEIAFLEDL